MHVPQVQDVHVSYFIASRLVRPKGMLFTSPLFHSFTAPPTFALLPISDDEVESLSNGVEEHPLTSRSNGESIMTSKKLDDRPQVAEPASRKQSFDELVASRMISRV